MEKSLDSLNSFQGNIFYVRVPNFCIIEITTQIIDQMFNSIFYLDQNHSNDRFIHDDKVCHRRFDKIWLGIEYVTGQSERYQAKKYGFGDK